MLDIFDIFLYTDEVGCERRKQLGDQALAA